MISGRLDVNKFAQIRLIKEAKFGNDTKVFAPTKFLKYLSIAGIC